MDKQYFLPLPNALASILKRAVYEIDGRMLSAWGAILAIRDALNDADKDAEHYAPIFLKDVAQHIRAKVNVETIAWEHIIWMAEQRDDKTIVVPYTRKSYPNFRRLRAHPSHIFYKFRVTCTPAWVLIDEKKYAIDKPSLHIARLSAPPIAWNANSATIPMGSITETRYEIERFGSEIVLQAPNYTNISKACREMEYHLSKLLNNGGGFKVAEVWR